MNEKNPYIFGLLQVFSGFSGADRLYLGCFVTGFVKTALFLVYMSMVFWQPEALEKLGNKFELQYLLGAAVIVWYLADTVAGLLSMVYRNNLPFGCDAQVVAYDRQRVSLFSIALLVPFAFVVTRALLVGSAY